MRNKQILLKVNEKEKEFITEKAKTMGLSVNQYIREAIFRFSITHYGGEVVKAFNPPIIEND